MTVKTYRKKPVEIQAMEWLGNNLAHAIEFIDVEFSVGPDDALLQSLFIPTLEGEMEAKPGDFIICGVQGEFYPCKPVIFAETYEGVEAR